MSDLDDNVGNPIQIWNYDIFESVTAYLRKIPSQYYKIFIAVFVLNVLSFGYLIFQFIYTNHVFPEMFEFISFPSSQSLEGRWIQNIVTILQGGGLPFLHIIGGISLQICNGFIFAKLLKCDNPTSIFVSATMISIHPFVADYYSFGAGHFVFVLSDFFVLAAFLVKKDSLKGIMTGIIFVHLGIACYQFKVTLIAVVFLLILLNGILKSDGLDWSFRLLIKEALGNIIVVFLGVLSYFLILKAIQWSGVIPNTAHFSRRLYVNNVNDIIQVVPLILGNLRDRLFFETVLSRYSQPLIGLILFLFTFISVKHITQFKTTRNQKLLIVGVFTFIVVFCLPIATYSTFLITKKAYWGAGRFFVQYAYFVSFLCLASLSMVRTKLIRNVIFFCIILLVYNFTITNARSTQMAYFRSIHELHFVNRLADKIEAKIVGLNKQHGNYRLVVVGDIPQYPQLIRSRWPLWIKDVRNVQHVWANIESRGFTYFRQIELVNFMLGWRAVNHPRPKDVESAKEYARSHNPWPHADSVQVIQGNLVVVVFQKPGKGVSTTMAY